MKIEKISKPNIQKVGLIKKASILNYSLKATPEKVVAITTAEYQTPALRPANSCLDTMKICNTFNLETPEWEKGVDQVIESLTGQQNNSYYANNNT